MKFELKENVKPVFKPMAPNRHSLVHLEVQNSLYVYTDYSGPLNGFYNLVVVDSYMKWSEIFKCQKPTATTIIHVLKELFSRFGVPEKLSVIMEPNSQEVNLEFFVDHCQISIPSKVGWTSREVCRYILKGIKEK